MGTAIWYVVFELIAFDVVSEILDGKLRSFAIAVHVFNLLFLRWRTTRMSMTATLVGGWYVVLMIVTLGPFAIATSRQWALFQVYLAIGAGLPTTIRRNRPSWSISLCVKLSFYLHIIIDYFSCQQNFCPLDLASCFMHSFSYVSAETSFKLPKTTRKRRGIKLAETMGFWTMAVHLDSSAARAWQLSFGRDIIDSAMLRMCSKYGLVSFDGDLLNHVSLIFHKSPQVSCECSSRSFSCIWCLQVFSIFIISALYLSLDCLPIL